MSSRFTESYDARRYRSGGTSWRGYLASTGRRNRVEELEQLREALEFATPDSSYWRERALATQQDASRLVPDDATWAAAHDLLPAFEPLTWRAIASGYIAMRNAIHAAGPASGASGASPLGPAELAAAFLSAQAAG